MSASRRILILSAVFLGSLPFVAAAATLPRATIQTPVAKCVNGAPQVVLDWGSLSGASGYSIFKNAKPSTTWTNISSRQTSSIYTDKSVKSGITYQYQVKSFFTSGATYSNIVSVAIPTCTTTTVTPTPPPPPAPTTTGEIKFDAYLTGYGWPDNTPASANISDGVIHSSAGGTGTYADPITIAVGHSIISGKDILDYPKGTKFYLPALRKYFIVEDTCGDGNAPQNGPCHTGYQGKPWLDAWVGGQNAAASSVYACEDKITGVHKVIQNPASNYAVTSGPIFNGTCISLSSEIPAII